MQLLEPFHQSSAIIASSQLSKVFLTIFSAVVITGCAGSASHKVVSANQAGDDSLTCAAIENEIVRTQVIIDGVNEDKNDISGADVIDGILWFPFNLVAKEQNYSDALDAADRRIGKLERLKIKKKCSGTNEELQQRADDTLEQLKELSRLHTEGELTDEEYRIAKQRLFSVTSHPSNNYKSNNYTEMPIGEYSLVVENIAKQSGCDLNSMGELIDSRQGVEKYRVACNNRPPLYYSCEWGKCGPIDY